MLWLIGWMNRRRGEHAGGVDIHSSFFFFYHKCCAAFCHLCCPPCSGIPVSSVSELNPRSSSLQRGGQKFIKHVCVHEECFHNYRSAASSLALCETWLLEVRVYPVCKIMLVLRHSYFKTD